MIEVFKVENKKQQKEFVNFPLKLYKKHPYYVPALYSDEMKAFTNDFTYSDVTTSAHFIAYKDGKIAGRLQVIIQHQYNEIHNEKRARFSRIHFIDDLEVSKALFEAGEKWAKEQGMDTMCGPLNYSDLEREGLLVEGFDQPQTFEEEYNYDYYEKHVLNMGYTKEVEWIESQIRKPKDIATYEKIKRIAEKVMTINKLHIASTKRSKKAYINHYQEQFYEVLDETYKHIYGVVPWTGKMKDALKAQFLLLINKKFLVFVCDENDKVVGLGFVIPNISKPLQRSGGHLYPLTIAKVLTSVRKPKILDFGLIGILPEYQNKGVSSILLYKIMEAFYNEGVEYGETNLNLTDNQAILSQWQYFDQKVNKRRRAYVKKI